MSKQPKKTFSDDEGFLHTRSNDFGKSPMPLVHDISVTDGACRLYAHMHWRYGSNCKNREGRASMGDFLDVSETTITNRVNELTSHDWIVVIARYDEHGKTHNFYHVFETQEDCLAWRISHQKPKTQVSTTSRKTRRGIGGFNTHKPKDSSSTQVDQSVPQLKLTSDLNSSSLYPDSGDPDLDSFFAAHAAGSNSNSQIAEAIEKPIAIRGNIKSKEWMNYPPNFKVYCGRDVWSRSDNGVYADRKLVWEDQGWGNPFREGKDGTLEEVVAKYEQYILTNPGGMLSKLRELYDMRRDQPVMLGCWCKSNKPCHCDVLIKLLSLPWSEYQELLNNADNLADQQIREMENEIATAELQRIDSGSDEGETPPLALEMFVDQIKLNLWYNEGELAYQQAINPDLDNALNELYSRKDASNEAREQYIAGWKDASDRASHRAPQVAPAKVSPFETKKRIGGKLSAGEPASIVEGYTPPTGKVGSNRPALSDTPAERHFLTPKTQNHMMNICQWLEIVRDYVPQTFDVGACSRYSKSLMEKGFTLDKTIAAANLYKTWIEALPAVPILSWNVGMVREVVGLSLFAVTQEVTCDEVTRFIKSLREQPFWASKLISFDYVCKNIGAWKTQPQAIQADGKLDEWTVRKGGQLFWRINGSLILYGTEKPEHRDYLKSVGAVKHS